MPAAGTGPKPGKGPRPDALPRPTPGTPTTPKHAKGGKLAPSINLDAPVAPTDAALVKRAMELLGVTDPAALIEAIKDLIPGDDPTATKTVASAMSRLRNLDAQTHAMKAALDAAHNALVEANAEIAARQPKPAHSETEANARFEALMSRGKALPDHRTLLVAFARSDARGFDAAAATLPEIVPMSRQARPWEARGMGTTGTATNTTDPDPVRASLVKRGWDEGRIAEHFEKTGYVPST